jgi:hypothetical protein
MAQKTQILLIDDLDGASADETVTFALDGVSYEIDLTAAHATELRDALSSWTGSARRVSGGKAARGRATTAGRRSSDAAAVREWANANGHHLSDRGRIPAEIREAYDAAH